MNSTGFMICHGNHLDITYLYNYMFLKCIYVSDRYLLRFNRC